jgi:hypothetical protein
MSAYAGKNQESVLTEAESPQRTHDQTVEAVKNVSAVTPAAAKARPDQVVSDVRDPQRLRTTAHSTEKPSSFSAPVGGRAGQREDGQLVDVTL